MFHDDCGACQRREPVFPSQLTGVENTAEGILVSFECWCGAPRRVLMGRAVGGATIPVPTPTAAAPAAA